MKKIILSVLICAVCLLVPALAACNTNSANDAPRFDGMNISEVSPLTDGDSAARNAAKETFTDSVSFASKLARETLKDGADTFKEVSVDDGGDKAIKVPEDNMPAQPDTPIDIADEIISELNKENGVDADDSNSSFSFYAETNQDVFITVSLINPKSYSILRFTLNGTVYQSYQFESGSSSTMLVLKVNSGNVCGIKEFTIDEIKYVDDSDNNNIKDAIIEGNRSVKLNVAYDKSPSVEVLNESMDYSKYSADFYVSDYYDLINYDNGCRLYVYDGVEKVKEIKLQKGSNSVTLDSLVMGKTYKCVIVGLYDRYDEEGFCAHVLYENEINPSAFCSFTDVKADFDKVTFGYKILNSIVQVTEILLLDASGDAIAKTDGKSFENLTADTQYQLRIYYTFDMEGEKYVFYDKFNVKTKTYPVPSVSATYNVRGTAIDFDLHIDDDFNLLTLTGIKLYDQNGEFVASASADDKTIDGLAMNKNYVLKFIYTYDLKDGKGEVKGEKVIAFSTNKAVPVVEIKPYLATETTLQFDLLVTDPNVVGRINSIRLFKKAGNVYVDALTNVALRSFSSLTPNTDYIIEVGYVYDMNDGNGSQIITYSEEMTTAKRVPTCGLEVTASADSLTVKVNENDLDNAGSLLALNVYDGETLVKKVEEVSALMTIDGLYSDREYTVVGEYRYNINDYNQTDITKEIKTVASTYAKTVPQISVKDSKATYSSFGYLINVYDDYKICTVDEIKLMLGTVTVKQTKDLNGMFDGLYSNNKYTVEVYFSYDLNDGEGSRSEVYRRDVKTLKRDDIIVNYKDMKALATSIKFGYEIQDTDNMMSITKIELFDANGMLVQSLEDLSLRTFEGLETESFYTIVTTYQYDFNDGKGVQTDSVSIKYGTSGSKLFVNSLSVINNSTPSVGEEVQVRLSLDNPHGLNVSAIYVSDVRCEVLNNSSDLSDVIVKFIPETEGGHYTVEVTGYEYVTGGVALADDLTSEYKQDIIVMGELNIVDYFAISDDYYFNIGKTAMRILEIYNPTGYEIYSLTYVYDYNSVTSAKYRETSDFTVIDENHLLIKEPGITTWLDTFENERYCLTICGITYGIEGNRVTASFDYMDCPVMIYNEEIHISTADDLLSIKDTDDGNAIHKYYILDNDIDMKGVTWSGVTGKGLFDGKGHTISNLTIVIEDEGTTTENYGLFKSFTGVIHDVHLTDIYYSVKTNSSDISVAGISASKGIVYNSSVSGTIRVDAKGGIVCGIANGNIRGDRRTVSTNNYVEDLQIYVSDEVKASLINYEITETRYDLGNNNSYSYTYSIGEINSMILGKSFVLNTDTNAVSYPYYVYDTSGTGAMYVEKELHNVEYSFATNCDSIEDFSQTGVSVTSINVKRDGYDVAWYDNPEFNGKEIVLPYMAEENTTLYAKWTRITVADSRYNYQENWIYDEDTKSSSKIYIVKDFGAAAQTDKIFVIGGYYNGCPVVGIMDGAFDFIRYYKDADGDMRERSWEQINELIKNYSIYLTSTVTNNWSSTLYASKIYVEANPLSNKISGQLSLFNVNNTTLHVSAEYYGYFFKSYENELQWNEGFKLVSFTSASSPFKDVVKYAETDEKNDKITVICADADNLKESSKYQLSELPYRYYEKDGYRWLDYGGTQFVIIDSNLYAGIEEIVEDSLFRYIIYTNGNVTIDAFFAPTTASVDLTALPYKITAIGDGVFRDSKLRTITLNEGLREIGSRAFYNCTNLTSIKYPSTLQSVGSYAFYNCRSLQKIEMNDGITKIEDYTFANYSQTSSLKEIVWSKNLKEIGTEAFSGYGSGINFILPEGLEKISNNNFYNCNVNIYVPASVKTIGRDGVRTRNNIFVAAEKKQSGWDNNWFGSDISDNLTIYWNVKEIKSDENYNYLVINDGEVVVLECINNRLTNAELSFAEGEVVEIANRAFSGINLTQLTLPESLKVIGKDAFGYCENLKYVVIPAGVELIGDYAFHNNTAIYSKANFASGGWDNKIAARTVFGCIGIEQNEDFVYVKEINGIHIVGLAKNYMKQEVNLTVEGYKTLSVATGLFKNNRLITSALVPEGVEEIGAYAFADCSNIRELSLPSTLIRIGECAFRDCYNANGTVYLTENVKTIEAYAFTSCGNLNFLISLSEKPEGWNDYWHGSESNFNVYNSRIYWDIAEIHNDGSEDYNYLVNNDGKIIILGVNDTSITEIDFGYFNGDVVEIGYGAFESCKNLVYVVLPQTIISVRQFAFNNYNMKVVYITSSVENVGSDAFNYNITILTALSEYVSGWDAGMWQKAVKSVVSYRIETEGNYTYFCYTVSGDSEEQRIQLSY